MTRFGLPAALALLLLSLPACARVEGMSARAGVAGNSSLRRGGTDRLTIGAYSVVREALHEGVLPAFARDWRRRTGRSVVFDESYSGSGAQRRAIASGFDADLAILSNAADMDRLVEVGLVARSWADGPDRGMITRSLVVIGVRPGNPRNIIDWSDLTRTEVSVVCPDPKTSGGARWNTSAIYGAGLFAEGKDKKKSAAARARARRCWEGCWRGL